MKHFLVVLYSLAAMGLVSPVSAADNLARNPAAPPETSQYEFILGQWHCETRFMMPDQSWVEGQASWTGYYILDGWAIKDDWQQTLADGTTWHGFNIRSFNPITRSWDNRWLPQGSLKWKHYESSQQGETMVMQGGEGQDGNGEYIDRNTFYDITADAWKWRKDRSYDGGESWIEGVGHISATRKDPKPLN